MRQFANLIMVSVLVLAAVVPAFSPFRYRNIRKH